MSEHDPVKVTAHDAEKKKKQRNIALALLLTAFIIIVYTVTILRIGGAVAERSF